MRFLLPLLLLPAAPALAQGFVPDFGAAAAVTADLSEPDTTIRIATGPWHDGSAPGEERAGDVAQTAWRIVTDQTTRALAERLSAQMRAAGWQEVFACADADCGGFDFRYGLPLITEPDMHVDLGDFRYVALRRGGALASLTISRATEAAFVQLTTVSAPGAAAPVEPDPAAPASPAPSQPALPVDDSFAARLEGAGSLVLPDVAFASGKATLTQADAPSLATLAAYMAAQPRARIALVGHTDASGTLAGNIALSRARAQAVRKALIALGVAGDRIEAEGVGYLAPRASNLSEAGRAQNRRVEVMLTSTQLDAAP